MRGIQNNLNNLQINQVAMEQAALQAAKNKQADRVRAEAAEELLKQKEVSGTVQNKGQDSKKQGSQNFKNLLYSKEGLVKTDSDDTISSPEGTTPSQTISHIDIKA